MRRLLRTLGPGLLLAVTSIGGSHLVVAPTAGARFGYALLWVVLLTHVLKYHAFEYGPRLALAADMSLLEGYRRLPGPRNWALWIGIVDLTLESFGALAAVAGVTGAILAGITGVDRVPLWTLAVVAVSGAMLIGGRYRLLLVASAVMLLVLSVGTAIAFFNTVPSPGEILGGLVPSVPEGSLVLVGALLGWMPTAVSISILHSLWMREDPRFAPAPGLRPGSPEARADRKDRLRRGLLDMRIGYVVSFAVAVMFLSLGAEVLRPQGLVPERAEMALTLSRIYTERIGPWMQPVFLATAFFAMFSTTYTVMDGMPRTLLSALRHVRGDADPDRADRGRAYWVAMAILTLGSLGLVAVVRDPVVLITVLAAVGFVVSPIYFVLNTWCVTHLIEDPALRPSRFDLAVTFVGVVFMLGVAGLLLYTEIWIGVLGKG